MVYLCNNGMVNIIPFQFTENNPLKRLVLLHLSDGVPSKQYIGQYDSIISRKNDIFIHNVLKGNNDS